MKKRNWTGRGPEGRDDAGGVLQPPSDNSGTVLPVARPPDGGGAKLFARGGVEYVVSDDHPELKRAIREVLREATWQRCDVHFLMNALDMLPRKCDLDCLTELRWLHDRRTLEEVRRDLAAWLAKWQGKYPKLRDWAEWDIEETLSFHKLPPAHRKHLKSTNMLEHRDGEGDVAEAAHPRRGGVGGDDFPDVEAGDDRLRPAGAPGVVLDAAGRPPGRWRRRRSRRRRAPGRSVGNSGARRCCGWPGRLGRRPRRGRPQAVAWPPRGRGSRRRPARARTRSSAPGPRSWRPGRPRRGRGGCGCPRRAGRRPRP